MHHNQYEVFPGKQFRLMIGIYQSNLAGKGAHKKMADKNGDDYEKYTNKGLGRPTGAAATLLSDGSMLLLEIATTDYSGSWKFCQLHYCRS